MFAFTLPVGVRHNRYPLVYDCGACGYPTCAEFLRVAPKYHVEGSDDWEFSGPICQLRCVDLGIAVGSAAKTASLNNVDARCQTRIAQQSILTGVESHDTCL